MRVVLYCPSCDPPEAGRFTVELSFKNDCVYEVDCPKGHHFRANILYHEFEKLFEVAVNALADNYYREAVGSFTASYERFMELFIRIAMRANGVNDDEVAKAWKQISRQSERQLGAFILLFVLEFGDQPPLLAHAHVKLRNDVVHKGYFPTRDECLKYGSAVLDSIRETIRILYDSKKHNQELIRSINDQGDFRSGEVRYHCYAWALIGTNRDPSLDTKTLEEMVEYVLSLRGI